MTDLKTLMGEKEFAEWQASIPDVAEYYMELGLAPFPILSQVTIDKDGKKHLHYPDGWTTKSFKREDFVGTYGIAIRLGEKMGKGYLTALDADNIIHERLCELNPLGDDELAFLYKCEAQETQSGGSHVLMTTGESFTSFRQEKSSEHPTLDVLSKGTCLIVHPTVVLNCDGKLRKYSWVKKPNPASEFSYIPQVEFKHLVRKICKGFECDMPPWADESRLDDVNPFSDEDLTQMDLGSVQWVINPLIPESSICALVGKRSTFKSYIAMLFSVCISSGKKVFDKYETTAQNILYIDEENGVGLLQERIASIKAGLGITDSLPIIYTSFWGVKLDADHWHDKLEQLVKEKDIKVIIVDGLRKTVSFDENKSDMMSSFITEHVRPFCNRYGITWIFLQHLRKSITGQRPDDKMDEIRGSGDFTASCDVVLGLGRVQRGGTNQLILEHLKSRRAGEAEPILLSVDISDEVATFEYQSSGYELADNDGEVTLCKREILSWCQTHMLKSFKTAEVTSEMTRLKFKPTTIQSALRQLKENGEKIYQKKDERNKVIRGVYFVRGVEP